MNSTLQTADHASNMLSEAALLDAWRAASGRPRQVAQTLGVSECALLRAAALAGQEVCTWLDPSRLRDVLMQVPALGEVMALTRNEAAVHEKVGTFGPGELDGHVGMIIHDQIDLRLFLDHWRHMVAVADCEELGLHASLQWFDGSGESVHKIFLKPGSDRTAFAAIVASARSDSAAAKAKFESYPPAKTVEDSRVDRQRLIRHWRALEDTHEFQTLLRRHRINREQALRLAPPEFATPVSNAGIEATLKEAAATALPIMVFVRNRGCVQIHGGKVERIESMGGWLNVLDPGFNLHLREAAIARTWVVRKPTRHGVVSALEAYTAEGDLALTLFGLRASREPEPEAWRAWLDALPGAMQPC